jgi:hypothetical protein
MENSWTAVFKYCKLTYLNLLGKHIAEEKMGRRKQTRGNCVFCGREMTKSGLSRHLSGCEARQAAETVANSKRGTQQKIIHLQILDAFSGDFWLHLEVKGTATLEDLDHYLRTIWLECCGHLSAFHIDPYRYTQIFDGGWSIGDEKPMNVPVQKVFSPDMQIMYEYDFGTTSELTIKVLGAREGKPHTKFPIFLMARNHMAYIPCMECEEQATLLCLDCMYEVAGPCELCETHWKTHQHDSENYGGPMPLINSPRTGLCGYDGPAEPPY